AWGLADPALATPESEVPLIGHDSIRVVLRRGGDEATRDQVAPAAVAVPGVHGVSSYTAVFMSGVSCDIYLQEGDAVAVAAATRAAAPHPAEAEVLLDAPFGAIMAFDYSYAERIRGSWMPQTIDT
ncbi:MAG: hypothetical protein ACR2QE_20040, partial [Acidimicrobiales bacterium]